MSEHIYLRRRNEEIRRLRFEVGKSGKEIASALRDEWPEINVWVVYKVLHVSRRTNLPKPSNHKRG
jgi:hypothetical protein